jgi:uncharacterized membrane protein YuzA (DUF378 family)
MRRHARCIAGREEATMNEPTERKSFDVVEKVLLVVAIVGAINWGLIGFFNFNLVDAIFGGGTAEETSAASRVVYAIVGVAGVVSLLGLPFLRARPVRERMAEARLR